MEAAFQRRNRAGNSDTHGVALTDDRPRHDPGQRPSRICAGGGGIPNVCRPDGSLVGVEAVIDKGLASALLARKLRAEAFLMLTDVPAVYHRWGSPEARAIRRISPGAIGEFSLAPGSIGPKVAAATEFVQATASRVGIGRLEDAPAILRGAAGTVVAGDVDRIICIWWE
jgi:carbamate kinase